MLSLNNTRQTLNATRARVLYAPQVWPIRAVCVQTQYWLTIAIVHFPCTGMATRASTELLSGQRVFRAKILPVRRVNKQLFSLFLSYFFFERVLKNFIDLNLYCPTSAPLKCSCNPSKPHFTHILSIFSRINF